MSSSECQLYVDQARQHMRSGDVARGARCFELALGQDGNCIAALCGLARARLRTDEVEQARRLLARALELDGNDAGVQKLMGELYAKAGRFDLAAKHFQLASDLDEAKRRRSSSD